MSFTYYRIFDFADKNIILNKIDWLLSNAPGWTFLRSSNSVNFYTENDIRAIYSSIGKLRRLIVADMEITISKHILNIINKIYHDIKLEEK